MMEYLNRLETEYLARLTSGDDCHAILSDGERCKLIAKLKRLGEWADREDAARERIRNM